MPRIGSDHKQSWRVGSHRLAHIHIARDHGAVSGRNDIGMAEIKPGVVDQRLIELHTALVATDNESLLGELRARKRISTQVPAQTGEVGAIFSRIAWSRRS